MALRKLNWMLKLFGFFKVPLISYTNPKIIAIDDKQVQVKIKLKRRTKNHLGSMYFGALAIGADVAGGFLAVKLAEEQHLKISLAFKSVNASFLKRPERDVVFTCNDGELIQAMLAESQQDGERKNQMVRITATCPEQFGDEPVAEFDLELSVKVIQ